MKIKLLILLISFGVFFSLLEKTYAEDANIALGLSGKILLQVESNGEAWYVGPINLNRYYLGRPADALSVLRKLGIGITNIDLSKIPIGITQNTGVDSDKDGVPDALEKAIGSNLEKIDSDNDGYNDKIEIENYHDPLSKNKTSVDFRFAKNHAGKIFLQVEKNGQAWYVNPTNSKRYFLGSPDLALTVMKIFGLGITNHDLNKIPKGDEVIINPPAENFPTCQKNSTAEEVLDNTADAIRRKQLERFQNCLTEDNKKLAEYILNFLDDDGRLALGNILSGSTLSESINEQVKYKNEVYFSLGDYKVPINFYIKKQSDGSWKLTNL